MKYLPDSPLLYHFDSALLHLSDYRSPFALIRASTVGHRDNKKRCAHNARIA